MDCKTAKNQLGQYCDNELPEEPRRDLETHLDSCFFCSEELDAIRELASAVAAGPIVKVPNELWNSIEARLDEGQAKGANRHFFRFYKRPPAIAASILLFIGVGFAVSLWSGGGTEARADTVDFGVLLDALPLDPNNAFQKFLTRYNAKEISPFKTRQHAPELTFAIPESLPGGFRLEKTYVLRFGDHSGIAASYSRNDEFLATIFHAPVKNECYGSHQCRPCTIGKGHGQKVEIGKWRMVHLADKTTCHCVLSQLDEEKELPAVMDAIAPNFVCNCGCQR